MAGRRQHFIPRMLLRCFSDAKEQVKVTHRDRGVFLAAVGNVALERDFFGAPGAGTVDDAITHEENRIDSLLKDACSCQGSLDSERAAYLIAHMTSRGRSIRNYMEESGRGALREFDRRFQDEESIRKSVLREVLKNPSVIIDEFHSSIQTQYGSAALKRFKREKSYKNVLNGVLAAAKERILAQDISEIVENFRDVLQQINKNFEGTVFTAHSRAMMNGPTPLERVSSLSAFDYEVFDQSDLILGDGVAWGIKLDGSPVPLFELKGDIERAKRAASSCNIFALAESLGGVESLIGHPASMTHGSIPREERLKAGLSDGLIRLSVGIEDVADLTADLDRAITRSLTAKK